LLGDIVTAAVILAGYGGGGHGMASAKFSLSIGGLSIRDVS